ncbi:MAG: hypothetical protein GAK35_00823 [Herbaspirillum frisingense]|uniref:Uncharacterized protein n=1 Tax=Herbaspirillum frisingense TaxID=92645 RepID=A0A7V8JVD3_9BURK|nr:MAG: hypothetical protein GAK35_00823 [Herbaspirillum frisingense]
MQCQQYQQYHEHQGQIEGSFWCSLTGARYRYLVSYQGGRSVDWHATISRGNCFSWASGTISHHLYCGAQLEEAVRAQVLGSISIMQVC